MTDQKIGDYIAMGRGIIAKGCAPRQEVAYHVHGIINQMTRLYHQRLHTHSTIRKIKTILFNVEI